MHRPKRINLNRAMRHRGGTVMIETLMALPMIMLVLGLIFYVGRAMSRLQGAEVMSRYETWRQADRVPDAVGPHTDNATGNVLMNQAFLAGRADHIDHAVEDRFPTDAIDDLESTMHMRSEAAERLLRALRENLPHGRTTRQETRYHSGSRLGHLFDGPIRKAHTRADHDWRFANGWEAQTTPWTPAAPYAHNLPAIRDVFFPDEDESLRALAEDGNALAGAIRQLYLRHAGYRGPTVESE